MQPLSRNYRERPNGNNAHLRNWLSDMDSNHDKGLQRALCYHYTIGHTAQKIAFFNAPRKGKSDPRMDAAGKANRLTTFANLCKAWQGFALTGGCVVPANQSSENKYSRSVCDKFRAKPSSPRTSAMVWALRCCSSQIFSSTVPGAMSR